MKYSKLQVSAGHWNLSNSGASGVLNEVMENRKVANSIKTIFNASQLPVAYIEDNVSTNQTDNVNYLIAQHNKDAKALNVQIHFNAGGDGTKAIGTEVLYANPELKALSQNISDAISKVSGLKNRGAKLRNNLGFLTRTKGHAVLIEVCFVNSVIDAKLYNQRYDEICKAISQVLAGHMGVTLNNDDKVENGMSTITINDMHTNLKAQAVAKVKQGYANKAFSDYDWVKQAEAGTLTLANYVGLSTLIDSKGK